MLKFRIRLVVFSEPGVRQLEDVLMTCVRSASIGEVSRALVRAGAGSPRLRLAATHRLAPLTLQIASPHCLPLILDSQDPVGSSLLHSGCIVEPILESTALHAPRKTPRAGVLTVLDGVQSGAQFALSDSDTQIGRARGSQIELHDSSVSRAHASIRIENGRPVLRDLGSQNGSRKLSETLSDGPHFRASRPQGLRTERTTSRPTEFLIGAVPVRIETSPPQPALRLALPRFSLLPSPLVEPTRESVVRELPRTPDAPEPPQLHLMAALAPLLAGIVLFAATGSPLGLVFVALAPLMTLGSWLDARFRNRRKHAKQALAFSGALARLREELELAQDREVAARFSESPSASDIRYLATGSSRSLWGLRPEHRSFLTVRLGLSPQPAPHRITAAGGNTKGSPEAHEARQFINEFSVLPPVPIRQDLRKCGALGVSGAKALSESVLRSFIVQITALHSPAQLALFVIAEREQLKNAWAWLAWLPHCDSPHLFTSINPLATDRRSATVLVEELKNLTQDSLRAEGTPDGRMRTRVDPEDAEAQRPALNGRPHILLVVLSDQVADRAGLIELLESRSQAGLFVLWLAKEIRSVPAICRVTLEIVGDHGHLHSVHSGATTELTGLEQLGLPEAETFAQALSPFVDSSARNATLRSIPEKLSLSALLGDSTIETAEKIICRWENHDSLMKFWGKGAVHGAQGLACRIGEGMNGAVEVDLRAHGPHALVAGTTGSGKSEFLQSWILALALDIAPDRLNFLLVDYKGGSAFAECANLPHTVGLVTDLDSHLIKRVLGSLDAELKARERLLLQKGAIDLPALEDRRDPDAPPSLVIVIDEFAALTAEVPEFINGVLDIAQRGRSLGLHVILATQRPTGVVSDAIRANTNLRFALRMTASAESIDVVGVPDAAFFLPEQPGRVLMQRGAHYREQFQAAFVGGKTAEKREEPITIRGLYANNQAEWEFIPEAAPPSNSRENGERDITRLVNRIVTAASIAGCPSPRRPWIEPLPQAICLGRPETRVESCATRAEAGGAACSPIVGLVDEPDQQRQIPFTIKWAEMGSILIAGGPSSGKTTALKSIACATALQAPDAQIYAIDCCGGTLESLSALPNVGAHVPVEDIGRAERVLSHLHAVTELRRIARPIEAPGGPPNESPVLLLIDGLATFTDALARVPAGERIVHALIELLRVGRGLGVYVAMATERSSGIPHALISNLGERLALRFVAETEALMLGVPQAHSPHLPPGRAFRVGSGEEIQLALPHFDSTDPDLDEDPDRGVRSIGKYLHTQYLDRGCPPPAPTSIPPLPSAFSRGGSLIDATNAFAVETTSLNQLTPPTAGIMLVTGPAGSGRTTTICSAVESIQETARTADTALELALLSPRRSPLAESIHFHMIGDDHDSAQSLLQSLRRSLHPTASSDPSAPVRPALHHATTFDSRGTLAQNDPPAVVPVASRRGRRGSSHSRKVLVIEDLGGFSGSGLERGLAEMLMLLKHRDWTVIVEGENATLGLNWELTAPLRGARWMLALQPDANDAPALFTTPFTHARRADFPPGRGFLVTDGKTSCVHIALPKHSPGGSQPALASQRRGNPKTFRKEARDGE